MEGDDSGLSGKEFENVFFQALDLLGLQYSRNSQSGRLWDLTPQGGNWVRLLKGRRANLKVSGTKWMFSDRRLTDMLPWEPGDAPPDFDFDHAAQLVKDYLDSLGLNDVLWLRPASKDIERAVGDAVHRKDKKALRRLMRSENFTSFDLSGYTASVTPAKDNTARVGSIAIRKGGRVVVRSERPRMISGSPMVAFRIERPPQHRTHPLSLEQVLSVTPLIELELTSRRREPPMSQRTEQAGNKNFGMVWDQKTGRYIVPAAGGRKGEKSKTGTNYGRTTGPMDGLVYARNPAFTMEQVDRLIDAVARGESAYEAMSEMMEASALSKNDVEVATLARHCLRRVRSPRRC